MGEIRVVCGNCGQKYKIPARAAVMNLKCHECGALLSAARAASLEAPNPRTPPTLSQTQLRRGPPAPETVPHLGISQDLSFSPAEALLRRSMMAAERDFSSRISGLVFLAVGGLMVAMQHFAPQVPQIAAYYGLIRNVLVLSAMLLVTYNAVQDGILLGLFCILFPPYLFLYANSHEEPGWVRGLFMGVLLGVVAEAYLMPKESLLLLLGPAVNGLIQHVDGLLQLASKPLDIP